MFVIGALPAERRQSFVEESINSLRKHLALCEELVASHPESDDPFIALAELGLVYETKARIDWLDKVNELK